MYQQTDKELIGQVSWHRNGICGQGFHVAIIREEEDGRARRIVVIRAKDADEGTGMVNCFALDIDLLNENDVAFGSNSWRGDHYADFMDAEIEAQRITMDQQWQEEQRIRDFALQVPL